MTTQVFDFTGARGHRLSGRLDLPDGPVLAYALFAHCFTCTKNSLAATHVSRALNGRGIAVLRFDFSGLGQSEGAFADSTFTGDVADLIEAARAMVAADIAPQLLIGHSLGGAAVLAAAPELESLKAVATIGAPFDVSHVTHQFADALPAILAEGEAQVTLGGRPFTVRRAFVDDLAGHRLAERIHALRRPLLVMHAPLDETVGVDNAQQIFLAARHPKSYVSLDSADHLLTRSVDSEYAAEVIAAWASRYLIPAPEQAAPDAEAAHTVIVEETGAGQFQAEVRVGRTHFLADEPVEVGGLGSGPSPFELVSAGLGACTAMTLRMYAERKGLPLGTVSVAVAHKRAPEAEKPERFERVVSLGGDLAPDQIERLMQIADRCPVHRLLEPGAEIRTRLAPPPAPPGQDGHFDAMGEVCGEAV
ncbi:bifunctional alpha/beta hydrolase/OsmC family protein [Phenylobacterium montanum]|uniref:OsmC family protein n=1 Tax=Phenylobacterium montanum TaxID=2823693 RepID=A0A975FWM8_9CAUL|nr:bifunctional alpha/beta hydrolase/OsmC family protein [Caulobacter sp. S6]QUD86848.1 OsmC family protein [Caulobacter sp. S6]